MHHEVLVASLATRREAHLDGAVVQEIHTDYQTRPKLIEISRSSLA
jgi:hypothetical protein